MTKINVKSIDNVNMNKYSERCLIEYNKDITFNDSSLIYIKSNKPNKLLKGICIYYPESFIYHSQRYSNGNSVNNEKVLYPLNVIEVEITDEGTNKVYHILRAIEVFCAIID